MQTTKKSYQELFTFVQNAQQWLGGQKEESSSKLKYAVNRVMKKCQEICADYQDQVEDLKIKHCSVDGTDQTIARDARGQYKFTKEAQQLLSKEQRTLFKSQVEVPQYIATSLPDDLPYELKEVFDGFVLNFNPDEEETKPVLEVVNE